DLMMKEAQVGFQLVNAAAHLCQLGAYLQNVLYSRGALQNRQILHFLGTRIPQRRFLVYVLAGDITRLNGVLLNRLGYLPHLRTRFIKVSAGMRTVIWADCVRSSLPLTFELT